jgi:DNA polymerase alpha subunit B
MFLEQNSNKFSISLTQNGPFVDSSHPCIKNGETDYTPRELFRTHFEQHLSDFLASTPHAMILVVPSVQDMLSDHAVFPQPRMNAELMPDHVRRTNSFWPDV